MGGEDRHDAIDQQANDSTEGHEFAFKFLELLKWPYFIG
jgi:hypothetical protein